MLQSKEDMSGWEEILMNNSDICNESSEDNGGVLPSLKSSYERMPPQLRICFSYCAIFPKGHNIAEDDLIHQWVALGFIKPSKGKEYVRQLLGMSFIQVLELTKTSGDHMVRYTMHDLVHDLATLITGDELIVSYVASKSKNAHSQRYCRYALVTKYDKTMDLSSLLPRKVRALHFSDSGRLDLSCGAFSSAECLRILDFSGCSSIMLPVSIGQVKQLQYLNAPRMRNEVLPEYITELSKLQYLNLNGSSHISALPESIGKLGCLKYLGLSGCSGISKLPESFGDLKCMMHLDKSGCFWIRELPESLGNLTNLLHLDMSGCSRIRELPESLGNLTNLQHLELSECSGVKAIPESLCGLTQLQYLNLLSCHCIERLPEAIGSLVNLQYLNLLSCCYLARLPEAIGCLVNLQYLNLSNCGVRELPESFKRLCNLLHLDLKGSCVKKGLPRALCGLTALQYLDMSEYMAKILENDDLHLAMGNLTNLKVLNLSCSIGRLFDAYEKNICGYLDFIGALTNLEHLDLSWNGCKDHIPESIDNLKRLHTINLDKCWALESLPESTGGATELKSVRHFQVCRDGVSAHSNLHLLEGENVSDLHIVSLENVRFLEEAQRIKLLTKHNLLTLKLSWTWSRRAHRHLEDKDLLGQLVPPMSLKDFCLEGYSSPSFPSWVMNISHHLPNLTSIDMCHLYACSNLPPLGQLPHLESLRLQNLPKVAKIDRGICGGKGAFPRLAKLEPYYMEGLEEWNTTYPGEDGAEEFMFPVLEVLMVKWCPRLRLKPCPPKCRRFKIESSDQVISSLEEVQTSSHRFPALQDLEFSGCPNLSSLPEGIQQLSSLQSLELNCCDSISALPEWLSDISSLKRLVIRGCLGIKSLPPCIQQLTNLQELVIYQNQELRQWCESEENKGKLTHINSIIYDQVTFEVLNQVQ